MQSKLLVMLVIVLVLFGGSKLPDLAKSLGKSMKEFKKSEDPAGKIRDLAIYETLAAVTA